MKSTNPRYINHDFYTIDEFDALLASMGGVKKFKSIKNFIDFMNVKQCSICKVYTSNYVESAHIERPPFTAALLCNHCNDFQNNHNHNFALQLAQCWINYQIVLRPNQSVVRDHAEYLIGDKNYPNMDAFTDDIKKQYHLNAKYMTADTHDQFTELEKEYDKFICHLWRLVQVQDETHFLFCGDRFTHATVDKVFQDTREIVNYKRDEFLKVYQLQQDTKTKLYRSLANAITDES